MNLINSYQVILLAFLKMNGIMNLVKIAQNRQHKVISAMSDTDYIV